MVCAQNKYYSTCGASLRRIEQRWLHHSACVVTRRLRSSFRACLAWLQAHAGCMWLTLNCLDFHLKWIHRSTMDVHTKMLRQGCFGQRYIIISHAPYLQTQIPMSLSARSKTQYQRNRRYQIPLPDGENIRLGLLAFEWQSFLLFGSGTHCRGICSTSLYPGSTCIGVAPWEI